MRYTGPLLPEYDPELKLSCEEAEADLDLNSSIVNSNPILEELGSHHQYRQPFVYANLSFIRIHVTTARALIDTVKNKYGTGTSLNKSQTDTGKHLDPVRVTVPVIICWCQYIPVLPFMGNRGYSSHARLKTNAKKLPLFFTLHVEGHFRLLAVTFTTFCLSIDFF